MKFMELKEDFFLNTNRIDHLYLDPHEENVNFFLHYSDLSDGLNLVGLIKNTAR